MTPCASPWRTRARPSSCSEGTRRWLRATCSRRRRPRDGRPSGRRSPSSLPQTATALTRAARVLAWGEMARQVAHEIKNPLTPIRLGIQHLQRVRGKGQSTTFEATLKETSERILAEIDRLDGIARAFSRFGAPSDAAQLPLEPVDLAATAREVVRLYDLGAAPRFEVQTSDGAPPPAL